MKKNSLIVLVLALSCALALMLAGCSSGSQSKKEEPKQTNGVITEVSGEYASGTHHARVEVEGYEPFEIELYADSAPVTVSNFCDLAESGYYNGLKFYRIVEGFCLQGGTKGNSASGNDPELTPILGEFSDNDIDNAVAEEFKKGTVAMARTSVYNSATSTFFITLSTSENVSLSLDGQYAAFGFIDEDGMEVVDKIVSDYLKYATGANGAINDPSDMPVIQSITIED